MIQKLLITFFSFVLLSFSATAAMQEKEFIGGKMKLKWEIQGDKIKMTVEAKTKGWIGIGFNEKKSMDGADIIIGAVKGSKFKVEDHVGISASRHKEKGGTPNITEISGEQKGDIASITFTRPFKSQNSKGKDLTKDGLNKVMLSFGDSDRFSKKHDLKDVAFFEINFTTGEVKNL